MHLLRKLGHLWVVDDAKVGGMRVWSGCLILMNGGDGLRVEW